MAILSFPVIIPVILVLIRLSKNAMDGLGRSVNYSNIGVLCAINVYRNRHFAAAFSLLVA